MEQPLLSRSCKRLWTVCQRSKRRCITAPTAQKRWLTVESRGDFKPRSIIHGIQSVQQRREQRNDERALLDQLRVVPASPSYFTAAPAFTDDFLKLSVLLNQHQHLLQETQPEKIAWISYDKYTAQIGEPVKRSRFDKMIEMVERLSRIHASMMPDEVSQALGRFKRVVQARMIKRKEIVPDKYGRTRALGRRKSSSAQCMIIEGDGEVLVNGRTLTNYFGRLHDRESAIWALKATNRADKYNVWVKAAGGGTTGQAEAIQLGIAKALLAQEPALERVLRRSGVLLRDTRTVERKKPGKLKSRKMPAWVKR